MFTARTRSLAACLARRTSVASAPARLASTARHQSHVLAKSVPAAPLASLALALCAGSIALAATTRNMSDTPAAIAAEEHFNDHSYDRTKLLEDLKAAHVANPGDVSVEWRLARAAYDVSNLKKTSADDKKALIYYAYEVIQKALEKGDSIADVHRWFGIILSSVGDFEGTKVAISNSYKIREHWEKAIALNPTFPTTYNLLGRWCMTISDLSWIERKAASVLFGSPPESSYDEALKFLLKCDELDPGAWKKNSMLIAQVYYKKKDWAASKEWTEKTLAVPVKTEEDQTVHEEAAALLKKF